MFQHRKFTKWLLTIERKTFESNFFFDSFNTGINNSCNFVCSNANFIFNTSNQRSVLRKLSSLQDSFFTLLFFLLYFKMTFPKCFLIKLVSINMYKLKFLRVQHSCYFMTRRLKEWGPIASRIKVCVFIDAKPTRGNKTLTKHLLPDILFIVQAIPRRRSDSFRAIFSKWNGTTTA